MDTAQYIEALAGTIGTLAAVIGLLYKTVLAAKDALCAEKDKQIVDKDKQIEALKAANATLSDKVDTTLATLGEAIRLVEGGGTGPGPGRGRVSR